MTNRTFLNSATGASVRANLNAVIIEVDALLDAGLSAAQILVLFAARAPLESPTFTGTPVGITKTHVGLGSVDNTADSAKPVSSAQQTALNLKANAASPAFTGTPTGLTKTHVGLSAVDNTSDVNKPVSSAQQTALDLKAAIAILNDAATAALYREAFEADATQINLAIIAGCAAANAAAMATALDALLATTGTVISPATAAEILAGTSGFLLVTPEQLDLARQLVELTPVAGALTIDCDLFYVAKATLVAATDISSLANTTGYPSWLYLTASGADRAVTATGAASTNFVSGMSIPSGKTGLFKIFNIGAGAAVMFQGYMDIDFTGSGGTVRAISPSLVTPVLGTPASGNLSNCVGYLESIIIALGDETTDITAGTAKVTFRMPYACTLVGVRSSLKTAATGASFILDLNETGVSVLSTKLSIDAGEKTSVSAAVAAVISDANLADDAEMTVDFDQVGSSVAGVGPKLLMLVRRT